MINASLWEGMVPSTMKEMVVCILKRSLLNKVNLDNFYSVFNLSFFRKVIENWLA